MPRFKIISGTFRDSDDSVKGPGETIELSDDMAQRHAHQLEAVVEAPAEGVDGQTPAVASDSAGAPE